MNIQCKYLTILTSMSLSLRGCASIASWEDHRAASLWVPLTGVVITLVQSCLKNEKSMCEANDKRRQSS